MKLLLAVSMLPIPGIAGAEQFSNQQNLINEPKGSPFAGSVLGRDAPPPPEMAVMRSETVAGDPRLPLNPATLRRRSTTNPARN
jgi:hypothetical protein